MSELDGTLEIILERGTEAQRRIKVGWQDGNPFSKSVPFTVCLSP